jgi:hypothetical protein
MNNMGYTVDYNSYNSWRALGYSPKEAWKEAWRAQRVLSHIEDKKFMTWLCFWDVFVPDIL